MPRDANQIPALWTEAELKALREMHGAGLDDRRIAGRLDRSEAAVQLKRLKLGLPAHGRPQTWTDADRAELIRLARSGAHARHIGHRLGRSAEAVLCTLRRMGTSLRTEQYRGKARQQES